MSATGGPKAHMNAPSPLERAPCPPFALHYMHRRQSHTLERMQMDAAGAPAETHAFQAEVAELLNLMVHSVYSETDIFLRELISNASDACDKLRYEAIANPALISDGEPPKIRIIPDKTANTLTIADTGIGMDRQELIDNL